MTRAVRVILVGPELQENLALGYLAGALQRAGHAAMILPFCHRAEAEQVADRIVALGPDLVGLGLAFQFNVHDYFELIRVLRERGFGGHITCGGHVPTFCHVEVMRDAPGLDTVVRHEGEETLVELAEAIAAGRRWQGIRGLVWREDGKVKEGECRGLVRDLDTLARPKRRADRLLLGGVPLAFLLTSRGCVGDCTYCCIRAFGRGGGPPLRMRSPDAVAQEAADLYHSRGVRLFFVQDDLFLVPHERQAVDRLVALDEAMRARGVHEARFWIKGRPDSITPAVLEAAAKLGAIHIFLGVENASPARLRYLGRDHAPQDNVRAIAQCRQHGILPSFNLMLFDPDCTLDDVSLCLDLADAHLDLPWNLCRTEVYSGTRLLERLKAQGRLEGDYQSYGYRMSDDRAEVMFRILRVSFQDRSFSYDSLLNRLITMAYAQRVQEEFSAGVETQSLGVEVRALVVEVHRDTVQRLRALLEFVVRTDVRDREAVRSYALQMATDTNLADICWQGRFEQLWDRINTRGAARFRGVRLGEAASS